MNVIQVIRRRRGRALLSGLVALVLTAGLGATVASPAGAADGVRAAPCAITFLGVHGLNEDHTSPTIHGTWNQYRALLKAKGRSANALFLAHPQRSAFFFLDWLRDRKITSPVQEGVEALDTAVAHTNRVCSPARLVIVGYSAGAWSVGQWLRTRPNQASQVVGVAVFGDPQWKHTKDKKVLSQGLAHRFPGTGFPEPYVPKNFADRFQSWCLSGDPVCGAGYGPGTREGTRQVADFVRMAPGGSACVQHCGYIYGGTTRAAQFLAGLSAR